MAQNPRILACYLLYITVLETIKVSKALTVPSNLVCHSMCVANKACQGHRFLTNEATNNCELISNISPYAFLLNKIWTIEEEFESSSENLAITRSHKALESDIDVQAISAGFDVPLQLTNELVFLKLVTLPMSIEAAQLKCLGYGGLLPLEDSDDFIEKMSNLVGDSISSRFTSLVREVGLNPNQPHLVWQSGRVETTIVGPSHPKYVSWDNRYFVVNPVTKTYESVASSMIKSQFYCQYLGHNLALNKATVPSSADLYHNQGPGIVDGVIDTNMWHIDESSAVRRHWFAVDLGGVHLVSRLLFLARPDCCGERSRFLKVWIGDVVPPVGQLLDNTLYKLCGEYPFIHGTGYLSGIPCGRAIHGRVVILEKKENGNVQDNSFHLVELLVF